MLVSSQETKGKERKINRSPTTACAWGQLIVLVAISRLLCRHGLWGRSAACVRVCTHSVKSQIIIKFSLQYIVIYINSIVLWKIIKLASVTQVWPLLEITCTAPRLVQFTLKTLDILLMSILKDKVLSVLTFLFQKADCECVCLCVYFKQTHLKIITGEQLGVRPIHSKTDA